MNKGEEIFWPTMKRHKIFFKSKMIPDEDALNILAELSRKAKFCNKIHLVNKKTQNLWKHQHPLRFMQGVGGHKVPGAIYRPLRTIYIVQWPIQQHVTLNICNMSHMEGKISFIGHFLAVGEHFLKEEKFKFQQIFKILAFKKHYFLTVAFQAMI